VSKEPEQSGTATTSSIHHDRQKTARYTTDQQALPGEFEIPSSSPSSFASAAEIELGSGSATSVIVVYLID
jgi:hypothetical protein